VGVRVATKEQGSLGMVRACSTSRSVAVCGGVFFLLTIDTAPPGHPTTKFSASFSDESDTLSNTFIVFVIIIRTAWSAQTRVGRQFSGCFRISVWWHVGRRRFVILAGALDSWPDHHYPLCQGIHRHGSKQHRCMANARNLRVSLIDSYGAVQITRYENAGSAYLWRKTHDDCSPRRRRGKS